MRSDNGNGKSGKSSLATRKHRLTGMETILAVACGLAIGLVIGVFVLGRGVGFGGSVTPLGSATIAEAKKDAQVVATYSYDGKTTEVKASDVIEYLGNTALEDGSFAMPTSTNILDYIRAEVLKEAAAKEGITVDDAALDKYADEEIGSSVADLATTYGMEEEDMRNQLRVAILQDELAKKVLGDKYEAYTYEAITEPTYPTAEDGKEADTTVKSKEYADYIIGLLGEDWDAEKGALVDGSEFAEVLAEHEISSDAASYDAAYAVYEHVMDGMYQEYLDAYGVWSEYMLNLFAGVSTSIGTIAA